MRGWLRIEKRKERRRRNAGTLTTFDWDHVELREPNIDWVYWPYEHDRLEDGSLAVPLPRVEAVAGIVKLGWV
jgi:hypothetical protein